jgi:hypothetical protein
LCAGKAPRHEEKRQHGGAQDVLDGTPHNRQNFHSTVAGFGVALHIVTYDESYMNLRLREQRRPLRLIPRPLPSAEKTVSDAQAVPAGTVSLAHYAGQSGNDLCRLDPPDRINGAMGVGRHGYPSHHLRLA